MKAAGKIWQGGKRIKGNSGKGIQGGPPGVGSTESTRPMNIQFPVPRHFRYKDQSECGSVHIVAGGPGRLQKGSTDALPRAVTKEILATNAIAEGLEGVVRLTQFRIQRENG
jgi:hypothetical protein